MLAEDDDYDETEQDNDDDQELPEEDGLMMAKRAYYPAGAAKGQGGYPAYLRSFAALLGRRMSSSPMAGGDKLPPTKDRQSSMDKRPMPVYNFGLGK